VCLCEQIHREAVSFFAHTVGLLQDESFRNDKIELFFNNLQKDAVGRSMTFEQ
jgi:hypothetical protein